MQDAVTSAESEDSKHWRSPPEGCRSDPDRSCRAGDWLLHFGLVYLLMHIISTLIPYFCSRQRLADKLRKGASAGI